MTEVESLEPFCLDEHVNGLSETKKSLAFARTLDKFGLEHTFYEGVIGVPDGTDPVEFEKIVRSEEFTDEFAQQLKLLAVDLIVAGLVAKGVLYEDGVNPDGTIIYRVDKDVYDADDSAGTS